MDIIDMYYNVGQHKTKVLKTSSTVNQLFDRLREFFARIAKPSSLPIFIAANQYSDVFGIIFFRLFSNTINREN